MSAWRGRIGITTKIVLIAVLAAAASGATTMIIGVQQSGGFAETATDEALMLEQQRLDGLASSAENIVETTDATLREKLAADVRMGERLAEALGGFNVSTTSAVQWTAINQFDKSETGLSLPRMQVGDNWFGQIDDPAVETVLVDEVLELSGAISTVFQRMNDDGDMLRIATNVAKNDGTRAIGTYIPATNPDGTPNAVVNTLLDGETFLGTAYVVNRWYITAYAPIYEGDQVIGSFFVGLPQNAVDELRQSILDIDVGENGYMTVIRGSGAQRGQYVFGPTAALDGQDAFAAQDVGGSSYNETIVDGALGLASGEVGKLVFSPADGSGDIDAHFAYYEPWDWVIVANSAIADSAGVADSLMAGRQDMRDMLLLGSMSIIALMAVLAWLIGRRLTLPLRRATEAVSALATGKDSLADSSTAMAAASRAASEEAATVADAADEVRVSVSQVQEAMTSMSSGMTSIAGSVGESSTALNSMMTSIGEIADNTTQASSVADRAVEEAKGAAETISRLSEASAEVEGVVELIGSITEQTKLLALNATIEAARAGDAGKGFAVVANEVKDLADQTASSSERIAERVQVMRSQTGDATSAIERIGETIHKISDLQSRIASAVEEQNQTSKSIGSLQGGIANEAEEQAERTQEIAGQVSSARDSVEQISVSVASAAHSVGATNELALGVADASTTLVDLADELGLVVSGS